MTISGSNAGHFDEHEKAFPPVILLPLTMESDDDKMTALLKTLHTHKKPKVDLLDLPTAMGAISDGSKSHNSCILEFCVCVCVCVCQDTTWMPGMLNQDCQLDCVEKLGTCLGNLFPQPGTNNARAQ